MSKSQKKKENNSVRGAVIFLFVVIAIIALLHAIFSGGEPDEPLTADTPILYATDLLVDIDAPSWRIESQVKCNDPETYERLGVFNHSFLEAMEKRTDYTKEDYGKMRVQYRFRTPDLRAGLRLEENPEFLNLTKDFSHGEYVNCETYLLTVQDGWYYETWDNGKKERVSLNLYEPLDIYCVYDAVEEDWSCDYRYDYGTIDFYYLSQHLTNDIYTEVIRQ